MWRSRRVAAQGPRRWAEMHAWLAITLGTSRDKKSLPRRYAAPRCDQGIAKAGGHDPLNWADLRRLRAGGRCPQAGRSLLRLTAAIAVVLISFGMGVVPARAAVITWDGGGGTNDWAGSGNWRGDDRPPGAATAR